MGEPKRQSAAAKKPVIPEDDPVWQAILNAPVVPADSEYECEEERLAVEEIRRNGFGRTYSQEEITAMIARRAREEG